MRYRRAKMLIGMKRYTVSFGWVVNLVPYVLELMALAPVRCLYRLP